MKESEEFARVIEWELPWDTGAPIPQLFTNGSKAILTYGLPFETSEVEEEERFAVVEFHRTFATKFGIANEDVLHAIPLYNKGLQYYSAHIIENSSWLKEIQNIHRVHEYFKETDWQNRKHYFFTFHDDIAR